jgi:hypothetical protein
MRKILRMRMRIFLVMKERAGYAASFCFVQDSSMIYLAAHGRGCGKTSGEAMQEHRARELQSIGREKERASLDRKKKCRARNSKRGRKGRRPVKQYIALMKTEGIELAFEEAAAHGHGHGAHA